ncbi:MAG: Short-chain dehydrogenase [Caulobacteraceae bacterium]|nr:Short-chain dehydrogenase [Caulobacteraceae bacterium]
MDLGIRGRKAIVNGGSAGLGRASALALAREGVELFVSARGEARLMAACEAISKETGAKITPIVADHGTDAGRETILGLCPEPDILVATCSPPPYTDDFRQISVEQWRATLDNALLSPIQYMQAVVDGMAARKFGRIVNIAAAAAKYPNIIRVLSGAPRAALANYCVGLARVVAKDNVTINTVLPAMHHTDGIRAIYEERGARAGRGYDEEVAVQVKALGIPAGKFGDAEDAGAFVAMFCSAQANYVTGQSLVIDGGVSKSIY